MKRTLLFGNRHEVALVAAGTALIAGTYGLVRLAYGLFLSDIQTSVGLSSVQAGYVASGASVVYAVAALVGMVADRWPRLVVVAALATASLGSVGMAIAPGTATFVPAAIISSAGAGLASPGLVAVVARGIPAGRRDQAQAVVNSGTGPGLVAAGALALVLLPHWRAGFAIGAAFTAAAGAAVLLLSRSSSPTATDTTGEPAPGTSAGRSRRDLVVLRRPALGALLLGAASTAVWTYGRTHLVAEGLGSTASTVAWMALGVGGTATVLTAGRQARLAPPRAWTLTSTGVALSIAALALGPHLLVIALGSCLVFGWGFVAATSALIAWASELVPDRAATGTAALFITLTLGQALGSSAVGVTADHTGRPLAFLLVAAAAALAAACGLRPPLPAASRRCQPGTARAADPDAGSCVNRGGLVSE